MFLADLLTLDAPRRTADGYLVARAKAARAGIYQYRGSEIDPEGKHFAADSVVNVFRPEDEVFDQASVASFLMKPVTNDHPAEPVTADNWKTHAKGIVGKALRDGDHLAFDIVLMDAATIADVEAGKRELSNGYRAELTIGDGTAPDGTAYQATQTQIRGNHVAVVDKGRAGSTCCITDAAACITAPADLLAQIIADGRTYNPQADGDKNNPARRETSNPSGGGAPTRDGEVKMPHTLIIDGLQVPNVSDEAKAAIEKLQGQVRDANAALDTEKTNVATLTTDKATLEAKVTTLEKQIEDAKFTPAQLRDAAKAYAAVIGKAKTLGVDVSDEMDEPAIMKTVVTSKVGDAAKDWNETQIAASFATLTKDVKPTDPIRDVLKDGVQTQTADKDVADAYSAMVNDMTTAWQRKPAHEGVN